MGLKSLAVMPEGVSSERVFLIRAYGGDVKTSPKADGIRGAIREVERLGVEPGVFLPRQFANPDNAEAHRLGTAREVVDQIPGGQVDSVVSGVGTGGTLVGMYEGFAEMGCRAVLVKGGHLRGCALDILYHEGKWHEFEAPRTETLHTHGTGCTYAAAITAGVAGGRDIVDAVGRAKRYITRAIQTNPGFGAGAGPVNHHAEVDLR